MKSSRNSFAETMELLSRNGYGIVYVPHGVMEDYNAAYNVICNGRLTTTGAAEKLGMPLNEIWISELWKPYERFIVFHELREIHYRTKGSSRDRAHHKTRKGESFLWEDDPMWQKMNDEISEMDRKTEEKKKKLS